MSQELNGVFLGAALLQQKGNVGGSRAVFVKLQGVKNDLVFPAFGGLLKNPFKVAAKIFAGDLFEYRTDANGLKPELYLLKTFEVAKATGSATDTVIEIVNDGYRHVPAVGDVLMVAPNAIGGTGTAVTVSAVTASAGKWNVTLSATLGSLAKGAVLVEAEGAGSSKKMLVKAINAIAPCDYDTYYAPATGDEDFDGARYMLTPALHATAYISKMSPLPACVIAQNKSRINGWFEI